MLSGIKEEPLTGYDESIYEIHRDPWTSYHRSTVKVHENSPISFNESMVDVHGLDTTGQRGISFNGSTTYVC